MLESKKMQIEDITNLKNQAKKVEGEITSSQRGYSQNALFVEGLIKLLEDVTPKMESAKEKYLSNSKEFKNHLTQMNNFMQEYEDLKNRYEKLVCNLIYVRDFSLDTDTVEIWEEAISKYKLLERDRD